MDKVLYSTYLAQQHSATSVAAEIFVAACMVNCVVAAGSPALVEGPGVPVLLPLLLLHDLGWGQLMQ